jgi:hypothetical protein
MYIPAENIYYETVIRYDGDRTDILEHALAKRSFLSPPIFSMHT